MDPVLALADDFQSLGVHGHGDVIERDENSPPTSPNHEELDEEDEDAAAPGDRDQKRRRPKGVRGDGRRRGQYPGMPAGSAPEVTIRLLLPAARIGGVIGRGGDVIKHIRESTHARINIAASGSDERDPQYRLVTVSGNERSVNYAVESIASHASLFEGGPRGRHGQHQNGGGRGEEDEEEGGSPPHFEPGLRLVIEASAAGQLIGKKGATISAIRSRSGARIQVVGEEESVQEGALPEERIVLIMGDIGACSRAFRLIGAVLAAEPGGAVQALNHAAALLSMPAALTDATFRHQPFPGNLNLNPLPHQMHHYPGAARGGGSASVSSDDFEEPVQVIMRVANDKIGRVIGKEGSTINKIRQESQCRIEIENTRSGEGAIRSIKIFGNLQQTQLAQQLITQKMTGV